MKVENRKREKNRADFPHPTSRCLLLQLMVIFLFSYPFSLLHLLLSSVMFFSWRLLIPIALIDNALLNSSMIQSSDLKDA